MARTTLSVSLGRFRPPTSAALCRAFLTAPIRALHLVQEFESFIQCEREQQWEDHGDEFESREEFDRAFDEAAANVVDVAGPRRDLEGLAARFPRQRRILVAALEGIDAYYARRYGGAPLVGNETLRWRYLTAGCRPRLVRPVVRRRGAGRPARRRIRATRGSPDDPEHAAVGVRPRRGGRA